MGWKARCVRSAGIAGETFSTGAAFPALSITLHRARHTRFGYRAAIHASASVAKLLHGFQQLNGVAPTKRLRYRRCKRYNCVERKIYISKAFEDLNEAQSTKKEAGCKAREKV